MKYRPEIDGLRAIAVIPVVIYHAGFEFFSGGFAGVDVFFVISGYLIASIIYSEIKNLNHMLAWGHAKVIEDILKKVHSAHALSDQFANPKLLKNALVNKGINITLHQRHRAEDNIAVAAASILARDAFVSEIKRYEQTFKMIFPKGCSSKTKQAATQFCQQHGTESLHLVSKLHFKLTDELALN